MEKLTSEETKILSLYVLLYSVEITQRIINDLPENFTILNEEYVYINSVYEAEVEKISFFKKFHTKVFPDLNVDLECFSKIDLYTTFGIDLSAFRHEYGGIQKMELTRTTLSKYLRKFQAKNGIKGEKFRNIMRYNLEKEYKVTIKRVEEFLVGLNKIEHRETAQQFGVVLILKGDTLFFNKRHIKLKSFEIDMIDSILKKQDGNKAHTTKSLVKLGIDKEASNVNQKKKNLNTKVKELTELETPFIQRGNYLVDPIYRIIFTK